MSVPWLAPLSPEDERVLAEESARLTLGRGETVFAPTRRPHTVFLLERGLVRIYRLGEGGAALTLGYVGGGEVFGELAIFGTHPRESFAVAALPSTVRRLSRAGFERLVSASPARALAVTRQIAERLKRIESRVEHMVFGDVRARLISILLELAQDFGQRDGKRVRLAMPLSQSELATLIGATRQTVNVVLSELRAEGLVSLEGGRLVLSSWRSLRVSLPQAGGAPVRPPAGRTTREGSRTGSMGDE